MVATLLSSIILLALISVSSLSSAESMEEYFDVKILVNARYIGGSIISIDVRFVFINKFMEPVSIFILRAPRISLIYSNVTKILSVPCKSRILDADARSSTTYAMARLYLLVSDVPNRLIINGGLIEVVSGNKSLANITKTISYNTLDEMYKDLKNEKIKAIVSDYPLLSYYASHDGADWMAITGKTFNHENYGFMFTQNSPYIEKVNQTLLQLKENGYYTSLYTKYFGKSF